MKSKILWITLPLVFLIDQVTKLWIVRSVPLGDRIPVIPNFFDIVHTTNPGAAFGFLADWPDEIRRPFFYVTSAIAVVLVLLYFFRLKEDRPLLLVSLALILGGAAGNLFDRIVRGEVVDFLSFHWYDQVARIALGGTVLRFQLEWPAFNIADAAITVAVTVLSIGMMRKPS